MKARLVRDSHYILRNKRVKKRCSSCGKVVECWRNTKFHRMENDEVCGRLQRIIRCVAKKERHDRDKTVA